VGGVVVDDHPAVAVQDAAAGRRHRYRLDAVGLRPLVIELRVLHLELPEARNQKEKYGHRGVLKHGDFRCRKMNVIPQWRLIAELLLLLEIWVDRRQDHGTEWSACSIPIVAEKCCLEH